MTIRQQRSHSFLLENRFIFVKNGRDLVIAERSNLLHSSLSREISLRMSVHSSQFNIHSLTIWKIQWTFNCVISTYRSIWRYGADVSDLPRDVRAKRRDALMTSNGNGCDIRRKSIYWSNANGSCSEISGRIFDKDVQHNLKGGK
jgi:hypothetical protein